jgi:hypothetical protein
MPEALEVKAEKKRKNISTVASSVSAARNESQFGA